jgi:RNA polymerase sigma-70 factor (ECF subfamily)
MMNGPDPEELENIIEKAKQGDNDAFSRLYTAYFKPLYNYVYFRLSSKLEAEDLVQDVFLKAYVSFGRYSYSGISPLAYFYTIARNTVIDYRRKKRIIVADEDESLSVPDDSDSPEEQAAQGHDAEMIRNKIALLSEDQQDAVVLRFMEGLSTKEIALMLGKSEATVRQLQSRGLRSLRKKIEKK